MAELAARADTGSVRTVQFVPSRYPSHLDPADIAQSLAPQAQDDARPGERRRVRQNAQGIR
jgi:hypothetical protein